VSDTEGDVRRAIGDAIDDAGLDFDDDWIENFVHALKALGYIIIREVNGVHPDTRKE